MVKDFEQIPTFLGYSEAEAQVGVVAGGGIMGYGGVILHEPTDAELRGITSDLEDKSERTKGVGLNYNDVATITVSGLLKWTNFNLNRAPSGRQDLKETGPLRIEVFDTEDLREYIDNNSKIFERLGIQFIG